MNYDMKIAYIDDLLTHSGEFTVRQIEERTGIPKSTVHRIVKSRPDKFKKIRKNAYVLWTSTNPECQMEMK